MRLAHLLRQLWLTRTSSSSAGYWERRYRAGMGSGCGSRGEAAAFKADFLNAFVRENGVSTVAEFGCGDGGQLALARYPQYLGLDVSQRAVEMCRQRFADDSTKSFMWYRSGEQSNLASFMTAELTLSLDVIYHLVEDDVYRKYLHDLFSTSRRYVVVYSSDRDGEGRLWHVKHRRFSVDVAQGWPAFSLVRRLENPHSDQSFADFYVFERSRSGSGVSQKAVASAGESFLVQR